MSRDYPWYEAVSGGDLEQGDMLMKCPNYWLQPDGTFERQERDCFVISHSCDLANDKLRVVQLCPFWTLDEFALKAEFLRSRRGKEELRRGNAPGYHLLNRCEIEGSTHSLLVVDFRSLFGIPLDLARNLGIAQSPRIRLLPPYREHLAQAFARFFMRVGLPMDVPAFI